MSEKTFEKHLLAAVSLAIKDIIDEESEKAQRIVHSRIQQYALKFSMDMARYAEVRTMQDNIVVTLRIDKETKHES